MRYSLDFIIFTLVGTAFLLSGCHNYELPKPPDLTHEMTQLRSIAITCGVAESQTANMSMMELLTDIKIRLNDSEKYYGHTLSEKDVKTISIYLNDQSRIVKNIREYDQFIKKINGKKLIVLPVGTQDIGD